MRIHELELPSKKNARRKGRGISAGQGKTAGRGTKGQNARSGGGVRPGFEGGQNPLSARLPKQPGFNSRRVQSQTVTIGQLGKIKGAAVDNAALAEAGIVQNIAIPVKVVVGGKLASAKNVKLQGASAAAAQAITKAGGKFEEVPIPKKAAKKADKKKKKT